MRSNFRTIIECSISCIDNENCGAFDWEESYHLCRQISREGLICDVYKINSVTAKVIYSTGTMPSTCKIEGKKSVFTLNLLNVHRIKFCLH